MTDRPSYPQPPTALPGAPNGTEVIHGVPEAEAIEKISRKAPQGAPREAPAGFDPLSTCRADARPRWSRRAAVAHAQPMRAIELKCLECCAWSRPEAARCQIRGCPLWAINRRIFDRGPIDGEAQG